MGLNTQSGWTCANCLRRALQTQVTGICSSRVRQRNFVNHSSLRSEPPRPAPTGSDVKAQEEQGAMSRRLSEMAEETMETGSRSDRKLMEDAGFSEELKRQLEERINQTAFNALHQQAVSEAEMPSYAGKGTQTHATARPWTGQEVLEDAALRMLDDSHKKLRQPSRMPRIPPPRVAIRPPTRHQRISAADRLATAWEKTSMYAASQQEDMSEKQREEFRKELKSRFQPGARPMPTTLQGLTSLANERIEDAIARGQFKNIQRGKGVNTERDYNANSPFLDTTEYFMNKIIQKQEIVPPWIEKQQELVKSLHIFRGRMRNDWKRHAARSIASRGGTLQQQLERAQAFALAEVKINPPQTQIARLDEIDSQGNLATVTIEERMAAGVPPDEPKETIIRVSETSAEDAPKPESSATTVIPDQPSVRPMAYPFRDPAWEKTERAYHILAITEINELTRSYNLMAPRLAQKPYTNYDRELKKCFAEVAPQLPDEIHRRATAPKVKVEVFSQKAGGIVEQFAGAHQARVRDEDYGRKGYGFKQFWKDIFQREKTAEAN